MASQLPTKVLLNTTSTHARALPWEKTKLSISLCIGDECQRVERGEIPAFGTRFVRYPRMSFAHVSPIGEHDDNANDLGGQSDLEITSSSSSPKTHPGVPSIQGGSSDHSCQLSI